MAQKNQKSCFLKVHSISVQKMSIHFKIGDNMLMNVVCKIVDHPTTGNRSKKVAASSCSATFRSRRFFKKFHRFLRDICAKMNPRWHPLTESSANQINLWLIQVFKERVLHLSPTCSQYVFCYVLIFVIFVILVILVVFLPLTYSYL